LVYVFDGFKTMAVQRFGAALPRRPAQTDLIAAKVSTTSNTAWLFICWTC
jgi:hypothetical protein